MIASPYKLRNGSWGVRVTGTVTPGTVTPGTVTPGTVTPGTVVLVKTRAGKTWSTTVSQVLWSGEGVSLCTTKADSIKASPSRSRGRRTGCSCGSREDSSGYLIPSSTNCWTCEHDA